MDTGLTLAIVVAALGFAGAIVRIELEVRRLRRRRLELARRIAAPTPR